MDAEKGPKIAAKRSVKELGKLTMSHGLRLLNTPGRFLAKAPVIHQRTLLTQTPRVLSLLEQMSIRYSAGIELTSHDRCTLQRMFMTRSRIPLLTSPSSQPTCTRNQTVDRLSFYLDEWET